MRRFQLVEIEDESWCPAPVRDGATDYLQFVVAHTRPYRAIAGLLNAAIERTGAERVIDLCSGAGGPWSSLLPDVLACRTRPLEVCLTDLYPNALAMHQLQHTRAGRIRYVDIPVDATHVPPELDGFRTLFSGFHHFPPFKAAKILGDAVANRQGIAVFELTERRAPSLLGMLIVPFIILLVTLAIRPFRWSRLLLTYLLPAIPLIGLWDGLVSCLRTYTPEELQVMVKPFSDYSWEIGQVRVRGLAAPITYAIGCPGKI